MKLAALIAMLIALSACTCDVHIKVDLSDFTLTKPAAKPATVSAENPDPHVYEYFSLYLTPEGLQKAKDHGWVVIANYQRYNGMQYRLRRIVK